MANFEGTDGAFIKANPLVTPDGHTVKEPTEAESKKHSEAVKRRKAEAETVIDIPKKTANDRAKRKTVIFEDPKPGDAIVDLNPEDAYQLRQLLKKIKKGEGKN
ncbi:MAG: hypothetical protein PHV42_03945 [Candidatus Pacebacteria bacterium]|nr:hypothetical protein [Candidatus Paceibacterota bacterium]